MVTSVPSSSRCISHHTAVFNKNDGTVTSNKFDGTVDRGGDACIVSTKRGRRGVEESVKVEG